MPARRPTAPGQHAHERRVDERPDHRRRDQDAADHRRPTRVQQPADRDDHRIDRTGGEAGHREAHDREGDRRGEQRGDDRDARGRRPRHGIAHRAHAVGDQRGHEAAQGEAAPEQRQGEGRLGHRGLVQVPDEPVGDADLGRHVGGDGHGEGDERQRERAAAGVLDRFAGDVACRLARPSPSGSGGCTGGTVRVARRSPIGTATAAVATASVCHGTPLDRAMPAASGLASAPSAKNRWSRLSAPAARPSYRSMNRALTPESMRPGAEAEGEEPGEEHRPRRRDGDHQEAGGDEPRSGAQHGGPPQARGEPAHRQRAGDVEQVVEQVREAHAGVGLAEGLLDVADRRRDQQVRPAEQQERGEAGPGDVAAGRRGGGV